MFDRGGVQSIVTHFYIITGIWCLILCGFIVIVPLTRNYIQINKKRKIQIILYSLCAGLLVSDLCTVVFAGITGNIAYYGVRVTNYLVYLFKFIYISVFVYYLQKETLEHSKNEWIKIALATGISAIGIGLITISQVSDFIYYFDEENYFNYSSGYEFIQIIFLCNVIIMFITVWRNRKLYRKGTFVIFLFYTIFLFNSAILDYIMDMWFVQNLTIFFSTQLIFLNDMFWVSEELVKSQKKLILTEYKANHDMMTGLWNKKSGIEQIEAHLNQMMPSDTAALGFVDIDNFKSVNDNYGHEVGDYWIKEVAKMLQDSCRTEDIVCRYGGDEYILFLKECTDIERLKHKMNEFKQLLYLKSMERKQEVHCSIGFCQIKGSGKTVIECIECADSALYKVKERGKNSYLIYKIADKNYKK